MSEATKRRISDYMNLTRQNGLTYNVSEAVKGGTWRIQVGANPQGQPRVTKRFVKAKPRTRS